MDDVQKFIYLKVYCYFTIYEISICQKDNIPWQVQYFSNKYRSDGFVLYLYVVLVFLMNAALNKRILLMHIIGTTMINFKWSMKLYFLQKFKKDVCCSSNVFGIQQQHCKRTKNLDITPPWPFLFIKVMNSIIACALVHSAHTFKACRRVNIIVLHYYPSRHEIIGWTNIALVYKPRNFSNKSWHLYIQTKE